MKRRALAITLMAIEEEKFKEVWEKAGKVLEGDENLSKAFEKWKIDYLVRHKRDEDLVYLVFFLAFVYDLNGGIGYYYETVKGLSAYDVLNFLSYLEEITKKMGKTAGNITYVKAKQVAQDFVNFVRRKEIEINENDELKPSL